MQNYTFNQTEYQKKVNKKKSFPILLLLTMIVIFFTTAYFIRPTKTNIGEYHFVRADSFQTYKDALKLSSSIKQNGGAGYIYFDSLYHVLICYYNNYDDAVSVVNNVIDTYPNADVYSIEIKKYSQSKSLSKTQNDAVKSLLDSSEKSIYLLSQYSVEFDSKKIFMRELKLLLTDICANYTEVYDSFLHTFHEDSKFNPTKTYALNIKTSLESLSSANESIINQLIKYETISIIANHSSLVSSL